MEKKQSKKVLTGVLIFLAAIAVMLLVYFNTRPETQQGAKEVTITVINKEGSEKAYEVHTDAEFLQGAMEDAKEEGLTFSGQEGEYGLMVDTVNDEKAVYEEDGAYWGFFVNGAYCDYGIAEQPVADGDAFEIRYTTE